MGPRAVRTEREVIGGEQGKEEARSPGSWLRSWVDGSTIGWERALEE